MTKLWIAGYATDENATDWYFQGVFDTEDAAVAVCKTELHFVAPAVLNEVLPDEVEDWEGCYYPLADGNA